MFISYKQKKKQKGYALILSIFVATFFLTLTALTSQYTLGALKSTRTEFQKLAQARNVAEAGLQDAAFWFESQTSFIPATITGGTPTVGSGVGEFTINGMWTDTAGIWTSDANGNPINIDGTTSGGTGGGTSGGILNYIPNKNAYHLAFRPKVAVSAIERGDTDDPRGIIRDIPIDTANNLYGHYEVLRYDPTKWKSATVDDNASTAVMDISDEKIVDITKSSTPSIYISKALSGRYWRIVSNGTLYNRDSTQMTKDSRGIYTVPYTSCKILGKYSLSENMLKLNYSAGKAAVILNDCSKFGTFTNARIVANAVSTDKAIICKTVSSTLPTTLPGVSGIIDPAGAKFNTGNVFGISQQELKGIASQKETEVAKLKRDAQGRFGNSEIIYLDGIGTGTTFTFDKNNPLKGGGILYVNNASLTLDANAGSLYTGIIYLNKGNLIINELNSITGSLFLEDGTINVNGGGEKVDIGYSSKVMSSLINALSVFKEDSLSYKSISVK